ncbi:MAG: hypothetical protein Q4C42_01585 [Clostridia bacterium]|nr:hypothetical protein [Clostridia bacterium]
MPRFFNKLRSISKKKAAKKKTGIGALFYHNTFVLIFSVCAALGIWVSMNFSNTDEKPRVLYDIPIEFDYSESAKQEGIKVFSQSYDTADVSLSGSSLVVNKVTPDDIKVVASVSPNSTKLTGNTLVTETIPVTAVKNGTNLTDYDISKVNPDSITISYDKYKEATFKIENSLKITASSSYYVGTPEFSDENVVVSGPASSVNRVSSVAAKRSFAEPITSSQEFECTLVCLDADGQEIKTDTSYLTLSVDTVKVNVSVLSKQTVNISCDINAPSGFSDSRISIDPASIDIAGDGETVSQYKEISLPNSVDFSAVNLTNNKFTMEIPIPSGVKNVSGVEEATVSINLNGYKEKTFSVPAANMTVSNVPEGKTVSLVTKSADITVVGSSAQMAKLSADDIHGTIDMASFADVNGSVDIPVVFSISSSSSNCWVYGKYTVQVNVGEVKEDVEAPSSAVDSSEDAGKTE